MSIADVNAAYDRAKSTLDNLDDQFASLPHNSADVLAGDTLGQVIARRLSSPAPQSARDARDLIAKTSQPFGQACDECETQILNLRETCDGLDAGASYLENGGRMPTHPSLDVHTRSALRTLRKGIDAGHTAADTGISAEWRAASKAIRKELADMETKLLRLRSAGSVATLKNGSTYLTRWAETAPSAQTAKAAQRLAKAYSEEALGALQHHRKAYNR